MQTAIRYAHMFVIEGMEKVREVIEKNRKRKLTKYKKLSNNTIIEIDNCSPLEILKLQQLYEELKACGERFMGYKECFVMRSRNLREKPKKRSLRKRAFSKMQLRDFCTLKYIQKRKNTNLPKKFKY